MKATAGAAAKPLWIDLLGAGWSVNSAPAERQFDIRCERPMLEMKQANFTNFVRIKDTCAHPIAGVRCTVLNVSYSDKAMDLFDQIEQLAVANLLFALKHSPDLNGTFKTLVTMDFGGMPKPVLLVGNADRKFQDGHVIAVSNPDADLVRDLSAGCGYGSALLKEIVAQRCDCMVDIHVLGADTQPNIRRGGRYKARHVKPAKFVVR